MKVLILFSLFFAVLSSNVWSASFNRNGGFECNPTDGMAYAYALITFNSADSKGNRNIITVAPPYMAGFAVIPGKSSSYSGKCRDDGGNHIICKWLGGNRIMTLYKNQTTQHGNKCVKINGLIKLKNVVGRLDSGYFECRQNC